MALIDLDLTRMDVVVHSEYREKDLVRMVPGTHWDKDEKIWRAPLSWGTCVTFRGVFGDQLEVGPGLVEWATAERYRVDYLTWLRAQEHPPNDGDAYPDLFPFQRVGVLFMRYLKTGMILADEMGTGKTIQVLTCLRDQKLYPALVVCPNSMKLVWEVEAGRWTPDASVQVVHGSAAVRRRQIESGADITVINWESLRLHSRLAPYGSVRLTDAEKELKELNAVNYLAVVADEAHRMKDPRAKQTRAVKAVANGSPSSIRLALTGTPIADHPGDLWSLLNFASPEDFPRWGAYLDRYCLMSWNAFGGADIVGIVPQNRAEFDRIVNPLLLRRLKVNVLPQLPAKLPPQIRYAHMSVKQNKAYRDMAKTMIAELEGQPLAAFNPLTRMIRLSQFASAYAALDGDEVRLTEPSCKVDALVDIMDEAGDDPLVVFAESRQLIELCEARLSKLKVPFGSIHGAISVAERQANVDAFQAGRLRVMLCTTAAGGEGITLTAASTVVFLQRSWSMIHNKQAEDRVHRPGQERPVTVIDVVAPGTVEEYKLSRLGEKQDRFEDLLRDKDQVKELLEYAG